MRKRKLNKLATIKESGDYEKSIIAENGSIPQRRLFPFYTEKESPKTKGKDHVGNRVSAFP